MIRFDIPDMHCGACADRVGRALAQAHLPAGVQVEIDIAQRQVRLFHGAGALDASVAAAVVAAIGQAGYAARPATSEAPPRVDATAHRGSGARHRGCCCGPRQAAAVDADQQAPAEAAGCCV